MCFDQGFMCSARCVLCNKQKHVHHVIERTRNQCFMCSARYLHWNTYTMWWREHETSVSRVQLVISIETCVPCDGENTKLVSVLWVQIVISIETRVACDRENMKPAFYEFSSLSSLKHVHHVMERTWNQCFKSSARYLHCNTCTMRWREHKTSVSRVQLVIFIETRVPFDRENMKPVFLEFSSFSPLKHVFHVIERTWNQRFVSSTCYLHWNMCSMWSRERETSVSQV